MQSMVYEVYHWYGMKDIHHTSAKHFQMIILHVPHFEPNQTKRTCGDKLDHPSTHRQAICMDRPYLKIYMRYITV